MIENLNIKNARETKYTALAISRDLGVGSSTKNALNTVLNELRDATGINSLKQLDSDIIAKYVAYLNDRLSLPPDDKNKLSTNSTANKITNLNQIINYVSPINSSIKELSAADLKLSKGPQEHNKIANSNELNDKFINYLNSKLEKKQDIRIQAFKHSISIQREFGLRIAESIGIRKDTILKALNTDKLTIGGKDNTKDSKIRTINIYSDSQRETLKDTLNFMKENKIESLGLLPNKNTLAFKKGEFKTRTSQYQFAYSVKNKFENEYNYHDNRRYFVDTMKEYLKNNSSLSDKEIKDNISEYLGHGENRHDIEKAYNY
jgi:hypothetical protein